MRANVRFYRRTLITYTRSANGEPRARSDAVVMGGFVLAAQTARTLGGRTPRPRTQAVACEGGEATNGATNSESVREKLIAFQIVTATE